MDNRYNRCNRRKYSLKVHMVLVTKYRKQILKGFIADDVKQKIYDICNSKGYGIIAMETDKDHIHFLISYDTTDRVCDMVKLIKLQTTYYLWQKYPNFFVCPRLSTVNAESTQISSRMNTSIFMQGNNETAPRKGLHSRI